jgi:hypothetical protein
LPRVGLHLQRSRASALPGGTQRTSGLERPFHGAVRARAVGGLQLQAREVEPAAVDVGSAGGAAELQRAVGVQRGTPWALFGLTRQAQREALDRPVGLEPQLPQIQGLQAGRSGARFAGGRIARDAQARRVQRDLHTRYGGYGVGRAGGRRVTEGAQAALPVRIEPGAAFHGQAGHAVQRGLDRRPRHRQRFQAAHPAQQARGVVQPQVRIALALGVRGLALPTHLCTGHLQGDAAVEAASQRVERALTLQRGVGCGQAQRAQFQHALRKVLRLRPPAAFGLQFAQAQACERAAARLRARRPHARGHVDRRARGLRIHRAGAHRAVQRGGRQTAPEQRRVEAAGPQVALPLAQR